jgi:Predicted pPIWI-associating nuclease
MPLITKLRKKYEAHISKALSNNFEQKLLAAAFDNLEKSGPLCFNNFSYAIRELLRHLLHNLAPKNEIENCVWFNPDKDSKDGITRAHRIIYAIQGGLSDKFIEKVLEIDNQSTIKELLNAINVLNKYTHIEESTFNISKKLTFTFADECLKATKLFIDDIISCRTSVIEKLRDSIDEHLLNETLSNTINSIDELASHHWIDEVYVDHVEIIKLGSKEIQLIAKGSISVGLQYGSNSDVRNDIGAVTEDTFPLTSHLTIKLERPLGSITNVDNFYVDTSKFYE